jgi:hypothetical protein
VGGPLRQLGVVLCAAGGTPRICWVYVLKNFGAVLFDIDAYLIEGGLDG